MKVKSLKERLVRNERLARKKHTTLLPGGLHPRFKRKKKKDRTFGPETVDIRCVRTDVLNVKQPCTVVRTPRNLRRHILASQVALECDSARPQPAGRPHVTFVGAGIATIDSGHGPYAWNGSTVFVHEQRASRCRYAWCDVAPTWLFTVSRTIARTQARLTNMESDAVPAGFLVGGGGGGVTAR